MSVMSNHYPEVVDAANHARHIVVWKSAYWTNGRYCSEPFATLAQAESFAHWLRSRVGEMACEDVRILDRSQA